MKRRVFLLNASLTVMVVAALTFVGSSYAVTLNPIPTPAPIPSSYGLEATKKTPPPTQGATITTPGNGATFGESPITVSGICPRDLLVQVYNNGVMVGSAFCSNGSFSIQVSLFVGANELSALVFDAIDQQGPESNKVTVNYNNTNFVAFGQLITLTSNFGRRAANPNTPLNWPLQLSGGTGPYAFSINWGDGSNAQLKSQASPGVVDITHTYKQAGIYTVTVTVTDVNGATAFLQLIAVANGKPVANAANASDNQGTTTVTRVLWIPALVSMVLLLPTYWLGRRSQVVTLRKQLQKNVENYKEL